jgi:8-oxo-dGTP diphosphatase/2-hydroxy-dATP diphosphatase
MFKNVTNMYIVKNGKLLLGLKKRGFGANKWNGFGGKLQDGETIEQAAVRECIEECGLVPIKYQKVGIIDFVDSYKMIDHVYICTEFKGEPLETEEMSPKWFDYNDIPYDLMWKDDIFWLPKLLQGKKFRAKFVFEETNDVQGVSNNKIIEANVVEVDALE